MLRAPDFDLRYRTALQAGQQNTAYAVANGNPKAALERRVLEALRGQTTFIRLGEEWGTSHSNLETVMVEVRMI